MTQDGGPCRGMFRRYAYDARQRRCVQFNYGGCRGNHNNFLTLGECHKMCQNNRQ